MQDGQHGDIGLASTSGSTQQHVVHAFEGHVSHPALYPVQGLHALEGRLGPGGQVSNGHQLLPRGKLLGLQGWHMHLFISLQGCCVLSLGFEVAVQGWVDAVQEGRSLLLSAGF